MKAAQYLRMSTEQQKYSLEIQAALIATFANREGYEIVRTYADAGKSGVSAKGREGLKSLIRDVLDNPPYGTVLVLDVSRWGRFQDPDEAGHFEFLCRSAGVQVRYCDEAFDDSESSAAIIMKSVKRAMAADYSRDLSRRIRASKQRRVDAGSSPGGASPYGFARQAFDPDGSPGRVLARGQRRPRIEQMVRFVAGPAEEVRVVRMIFSLFVEDRLTVGEIIDRLNTAGFTYRDQHPWTTTRVRAVLRNELSKGIFVYNRTISRLGAQPAPAPPDLWTRHSVGCALVSTAVFEAAQVRLGLLGPRQYTEEDLIERLKRLYARCGRLSGALVDADPETPSILVYIKRFGSKEAAFARVGHVGPTEDAAARKAADRARILAGLRRLLACHGRLSASLIDADPGLPSAATVHRHFGSFPAAYALVGYTRGRAMKDG